MLTMYDIKTMNEEVKLTESSHDIIYVRFNIRPFEVGEGEYKIKGLMYDEHQYKTHEFLALINERAILNEQYAIDVDYRLTKIEMGI